MSIVGLSSVIFVLSLVAGLAPRAMHGRVSLTRLNDFTGIASGLLLASALLVVIPEGFHVAAEGSKANGFSDQPVVLGAAILAGFALMLVLEGMGVGHAVHEEHHSHTEGHGHGHVHHPSSSGVLALGLSVHALADGLAIGSAAVSGDETFSVLVAVAVLLHRVPAAFSLGLFSLHGTDDRRWKTSSIVSFSIATPLAILLSYRALDGGSARLIALVMLFSAGTFVYVATVDTLPAIHNPQTGRRSVANVLLGAAVFAVVFLVIDGAGFLDHGH